MYDTFISVNIFGTIDEREAAIAANLLESMLNEQEAPPSTAKASKPMVYPEYEPEKPYYKPANPDPIDPDNYPLPETQSNPFLRKATRPVLPTSRKPKVSKLPSPKLKPYNKRKKVRISLKRSPEKEKKRPKYPQPTATVTSAMPVMVQGFGAQGCNLNTNSVSTSKFAYNESSTVYIDFHVLLFLQGFNPSATGSTVNVNYGPPLPQYPPPEMPPLPPGPPPSGQQQEQQRRFFTIGGAPPPPPPPPPEGSQVPLTGQQVQGQNPPPMFGKGDAPMDSRYGGWELEVRRGQSVPTSWIHESNSAPAHFTHMCLEKAIQNIAKHGEDAIPAGLKDVKDGGVFEIMKRFCVNALAFAPPKNPDVATNPRDTFNNKSWGKKNKARLPAPKDYFEAQEKAKKMKKK